MTCRLTAILASAAFLLAGLTASGCGGSSEDSAETPGTVTTQVTLDTTAAETTDGTGAGKQKEEAGGDEGKSADSTKPSGKASDAVQCDRPSISKAVRSWGADQGTRASVAGPNFQCAGSWAAALVIVGPPATGDASTLVLKATPNGWKVQNRSKVCPKPSPVPGQIYSLACRSN